MGSLRKKPIPETASKGRKLLDQSLLTLMTTVMTFAIRMGKNVAIARLLGPTLRGVYGIAVLVPEMIVSFGNLGFGVGMLYQRTKLRREMRAVMGAVLGFLAVSGILLCVIGGIVFGAGVLFREPVVPLRSFAVFVIAAIPFLMAKTLNGALIMAEGRIGRYNLLRFLESLLPLVLILALWLVLGDAFTAAIGSWALTAVVVAVASFVLLRGAAAFPPRWDGGLFNQGLRYGLRGHPANFLHFALLRVDFIFVSVMLGPTELGYYAIASVVAEILLTIPESVGLPLIPMVFRMSSADADRFVPLSIRMMAVLMLGVCLLMALTGKFFVHLLYGAAFLPAYSALALLMPGIAALGIYPILKIDLFNRGRPGTVSLITAAALLLNIALNFFWIPRWGIVGAAASSSVGYLAAVLMLLAVYTRETGTHLLQVVLVNGNDIAVAAAAIREKLARRSG